MSASAAQRQLVLDLGHDASYAREDFIRGEANAVGLALIDRWPDWPDRAVVVVGPEGSGKSHLAAIWAARSGARGIAADAVDHVDVPDLLATGALVIENLEPGDGLDERALFHLLNLVREERASLLITTRSLPAGWTLQTPDLASRLRALPVVSLALPDEKLLRALLMKLAADRQLDLDDSVVNYLIVRVERSFAGIQEAIARLDHAAMQQKRPVTRALAAELFRDGTA
jgi:chromosomal replication initiation ATPase DnaA